MKKNVSIPIIPISAKEGTNLEILLETLKEMVESEKKISEEAQFL